MLYLQLVLVADTNAVVLLDHIGHFLSHHHDDSGRVTVRQCRNQTDVRHSDATDLVDQTAFISDGVRSGAVAHWSSTGDVMAPHGVSHALEKS